MKVVQLISTLHDLVHDNQNVNMSSTVLVEESQDDAQDYGAVVVDVCRDNVRIRKIVRKPEIYAVAKFYLPMHPHDQERFVTEDDVHGAVQWAIQSIGPTSDGVDEYSMTPCNDDGEAVGDEEYSTDLPYLINRLQRGGDWR